MSLLRGPVRQLARRSVQHAIGVREGLAHGASAVALTFDDGPDPDFTPAVLDQLAETGARATFFLVGEKAERHPDLARRIHAEGHAVGSHSHTHPDPWDLPPRRLLADYRRGHEAVRRVVPGAGGLFRPPKGYLDPASALVMAAARLRPWLWTIDPEDWRPGTTPGRIVAGLDELSAGDVVLLHDSIERPLDPTTTDRTATLHALPAMLRLIHDRRLQCVVLPDG